MPEAPKEPRAIYYTSLVPDLPASYFQDTYESDSTDPSDPRGPTFVKRLGKTFVLYRIPTINAGQSVDDLDPFFIMFDQSQQDVVLPLKVSVYEESLREPTESTLYLSVKVQRAESQGKA